VNVDHRPLFLGRVSVGLPLWLEANSDQETQTMLEVEHKRDERIAAIHYARVNVKSLAAEAKVIRRETERAGKAYKDGLAVHRRGRLREEARYAHLALAFFRHSKYRSVEEKCYSPPSEKRLHEKASRFQWGLQMKDVSDWLKQ
jgi:hypothetical protein